MPHLTHWRLDFSPLYRSLLIHVNIQYTVNLTKYLFAVLKCSLPKFSRSTIGMVIAAAAALPSMTVFFQFQMSTIIYKCLFYFQS